MTNAGSAASSWSTRLLVFLCLCITLVGCDRHSDHPTSKSLTELRRGNGPEPDSLDPALARTDSAANILRDAYEGLATLDAQAVPAPGVASSWDVSADGRIYTFHLRDSARWSNGEPVTADDFVASWQRLVSPATGSQYAAVLKPVLNAAEILQGRAPVESLGVTAQDTHTLLVRLSAPTTYFPGLVTHWSTFPTYHGKAPMPAGKTISNGAYQLSSWVVGMQARLTKNPHYWNASQVAIEAVRFVHIADANDEYTRYRAGDIDATYTLPQMNLKKLQEAHGAAVHRGPQLGVYYYGFNLTKAPFKDAPQLRLALSMSIDRERLVNQVTGLGELAAYSWVPTGVANYTPQQFSWAAQPHTDRVKAAQALYKQAGYSEQKPLTIEIRFPSGPTHERIALSIASMWKEALGVQTNLVGEEFKSLLQTINRGDVQIFRSSWIGDYNDASTFTDVLGSGFGINLPHYKNSEFDSLLAAAASESDTTKRRQTLQNAERLMLTNMPLIPLYFYVNKHLVAPRVDGWYDNVMNVVYTKDLRLTH